MTTNSGERSLHHFVRAVDLADNYPDLAFLECRRIMEIMIKDIYCEKMNVNEVPKKLNTIENIRGDLAQNKYKLPRVVDACMGLVQQLGNFGAHDQGGAEMEIDRMFMEACIVSTQALLRWRYPEFLFNKSELSIKPVLSIDIKSDIKPQETPVEIEISKPTKTLRVRMREFVESNYEIGEVFKIGDLKRRFGEANPHNSPNAIHGHITLMSANLPSRLSHQPKKDGSDDLLFRVSKGMYRRYVPAEDPEPIMHQNVPEHEWSSRLLVVNAARTFHPVKNSRCYLSPDTGGSYKYSRAAYIGLYKDKTVRCVGEILGKVIVSEKGSEPIIDWINDEEIPEDTLTELARVQIEQRWETYPVKALVIGQLYDTELIKDSKGGMIRNNFSIDISELEHTSAEELSESLNGLKYSDIIN